MQIMWQKQKLCCINQQMSKFSCSSSPPLVLLNAAPPQARKGIRYSKSSVRAKANLDLLNVGGLMSKNDNLAEFPQSGT